MDKALNSYSTAALAYLGDCVIELCTREYLVGIGVSSSGELNRRALEFVRAPAQARAMKNIIDMLDEEENAVFHRGRNIGHTNVPRASTVAEYRAATGMEALFGYLHLAGKTERITELFRLAYSIEN